MIVVDTNVMVRLVVGGADGTDAAMLFERETEWAAPSILMSELHNVLIGFVRRGTVTSEQAKAMSDDAAVVLGDRIASVSGHQVIDVALECGLTCLRCRVRRARSGPGRSFGYSGQRGSARRRRRGGVVADARALAGIPPFAIVTAARSTGGWIIPIDTARDILVGISLFLQKRPCLPNNPKQPYRLDQD